MRTILTLLLATVVAGFLGGCGNGSNGAAVNSSTARGTLIQNPPLRVASVNVTDLTAQLNSTASGQQLAQLAGAPTCGIDYHYIQYETVGGAGESTTATGVMMVPTGSAAICTGPRPIVLYAHGTTTDKNFNLAAVADSTNSAYSESGLIGAMFAAQGYIVVAPNYAGYDASTLSYHPYLNASQQSKDMIDALTAARSALGHIFASGITDNGKLFITGYSQGGHVAMATHQAMQALGLPVTAAAPMSGPYALAAFGDAIFYGAVDIGATIFAPLMTTSYQKAYGNIYSATTDIYSSTYATGIDTLLPSTTPMATLFTQNSLPQTALFNRVAPTGTGSTPLDTLFAGITPPSATYLYGYASSNYLITNTYRVGYVADAVTHPDGWVPSPPATTPTTTLPALAPSNTFRIALKANDLRSGFGSTGPTAPVLLCGGHNDPTVFYPVNADSMATILRLNPYVSTIDVDASAGYSANGGNGVALSTTPNGGLAALEAGVQPIFAGGLAAASAVGGATAVAQAYHGTLVPPACTKAAQLFFKSIYP